MTRIVKKPEERWQDIVLAAWNLFLENEYEKTTMDDVAKKIGIAKGTLYHYFNSKEELLDAVVLNYVDEYMAEIQTAMDEAKGNALDKMQLLTKVCSSDGQDRTIERLHRPGNIGLHARLMAVNVTKLAPIFAAIIKQGCDEGLFHVKEPLAAAEFILAGSLFLMDLGVNPWTQEDLTRRSLALPHFIEKLLQAPAGSFKFIMHNL